MKIGIASAFLLLCTAAFSGCGEDDPQFGSCPSIESNTSCQPETADLRPHFITPSELYMGANGRDLYQAALQANFGDMQVTVVNPDIACASLSGCIAPNETGFAAIVTAQTPGTTTIEVRSGSVAETITVHVADYTTEQYDLGEQRYNSPANANATDRRACSSCHNGQGGASHSPLALAGKSDIDLLSSIQNGQLPDICENDVGQCDCTPAGEDCSACSESNCEFNAGYVLTLEAFGGGVGDHVFDLSPEEVQAIMAYIRAIKLEL